CTPRGDIATVDDSNMCAICCILHFCIAFRDELTYELSCVKTSSATGLSKATIGRILKEKRETNELKSPSKKRP
ncbi:hypothetical protein L9F63_017514, partial [Diploptera punctata]